MKKLFTFLLLICGLNAQIVVVSPSSGGATLDGVTAATASQAGIANGNFNIRWNWAKTSNSQTAFEFGESAAATGGTSTSGVPNQVLGKFSTLAGSTMSPLSVYSRAAHVFSVSPTTPQVVFNEGSLSQPSIAFFMSGSLGSGFWADTSNIRIRVNVGSVASAGFGGAREEGAFIASRETTYSYISGKTTLYGASSGSTANIIHYRSVQAQTTNSTQPNMAWMRSRGTLASPTVITTGDDLGYLSGYGYVGATNAYVEAASILFDSVGTISDSTTGIGGRISFQVREVGGSVTETASVTPAGLSVPGGIKRVTAQFDKTDTTLTNVTGLSVPLRAATSYRFRAVLFTTSNVAGGVKAAVASSGSVTDIIYEGFTNSAGTITQTRATASGTEVGAVTAVTAATIVIEGSILTNAAGNLTVQFAENVAVATSSVLVGSYLEVFGF